jgi:O-antigen ligase
MTTEMTDTISLEDIPRTASAQARRATRGGLAWLAVLVSMAGVVGLLLLYSGSVTSSVRGPSPAVLAWVLYLLGAAAILAKPRCGVYLIVFLSLAGDGILVPWYPFCKNLSSPESLLYLNSALIFSPLETYLVLTLISWLGRGALRRKLPFFLGTLFWPVITFTCFVTFGLVYGLVTGGNANIGLWECRPIFYLPLMLILTSNLLENRAHVSNLLWAAVLALLLEGIAGNLYFFVTLEMDLGRVEAITEHSAAIHMNTLFVLVIAAWLYKASPAKRLVLPLLVPSVGLTYLATQRRAGFLSLAIALVLIAFVLYRVNRRAFWLIAPPLALFGLAYLAAFWNSAGAIGLPARAVRSVFVEDTSSGDYSSNLYRVIENINTSFTIHAAPLTGVGFGKQFFIVASMPDISFFAWWQYITHNSILWIWVKTGIGGFLSMTMLIGIAIAVGVRALWRMPRGDLSAAALTASLYLVMHFVYAYVDMSWDSQSMVYMGAMMGLLNCLERLVARPVEPPRKRWHWQPEPPPTHGLEPVPGEESR